MKSFKRLILVLALFAVYVSAGAAQEKPETTSKIGEIETNYDAAKNETTVGFQQLVVADSPAERLYLSVEGTYATRTPKNHPDDIIFIISALSPNSYRYPNTMSLNINADGKQLPQVLMLNLDKRRAETSYLETIGTRMKYDIFLKIAQAKKVEMRLNETSITLTPQHLQKMRELSGLLHQ